MAIDDNDDGVMLELFNGSEDEIDRVLPLTSLPGLTACGRGGAHRPTSAVGQLAPSTWCSQPQRYLVRALLATLPMMTVRSMVRASSPQCAHNEC